MFRSLFLILLLIKAVVLSAQISKDREQDPLKNTIIEQRIELIAEQFEEEDIDFTTLFDELSGFYDRPVNLNTATRENLEQLHLLNDIQVNALLSHIESNGKLISIYELQAVQSFDMETIEAILPFVKVSADLDRPRLTMDNILNNGKSELFFRYIRVLEEMQGFSPTDDSTLAKNPNSRYQGSPDRLYTRYRFRFGNNVSIGVTGEKDAGEELFKGSQSNGFDFYSAHVYLRNMGKVKHMAIGDYQVQFGQGLTFWSGLAFSKSASVMSIKKNALAVRPYTSVDENLFMRGAATTVEINNFEITGFFSQKGIDANVTSQRDTLDNNEGVIASSFQTSGFHRTPSELANKNAVKETLFGGHVAFKTRRLNIGATAVRSMYDAELRRNLRAYNKFEFNSSSNLNLGIDYSYIFQNINLFGEVARSENGGTAFLNGALMSLDPRFSFSVLHRNYQADYQSYHSFAFAENTRNINEQGLYFGVEAKPFKNFTFTGYFDQFRFPWLRFRVNSPSTGVDYLSQLNYRPDKKLEIYIRHRKRIRSRNTLEEYDGIRFTDQIAHQNFRVNITYKVSESIRLRNRVEFVTFDQGEQARENGFMVFQDISYKPFRSPVSFDFRLAFFDTESFNSAIYAYENDVLYFFSIPAYFNRGMRTYLTLKYKVVRGIELWLRYAQTAYTNVDEIGGGRDRIAGNTRSEVKAQFRFKF